MVTALDAFAKLEAEGLYRAPEAPEGREVVLSFGGRSLVIVTTTDVALAHWPLATLCLRSDPGALPMVLAPDRDGPETVSLTDPIMIDAIGQVCPDLSRPVPRPRRRWLGWVVLGAGVAAMIATSATFAPEARQALIRFLGAERSEYLGARLKQAFAEDARATTLKRCSEPEGLAALGAMAARVGAPTAALDLTVVRGAEGLVLALPGGVGILSEDLILTATTPEAVAGILARLAAANRPDVQMRAFLVAADTLTTARLAAGLSVGEAEARDILAIFRETGVQDAGRVEQDQSTGDMLAAAGLPTLAYAELAAEAALPLDRDTLIRADRIGIGTYTPVLDDLRWLALRNICDRTERF